MIEKRAQEWNASGYDRNARFVSDLGLPLIGVLDPKPGERILDLGCGDGVLAEQISQAGADVVGIDTSESLLAAARGRGVGGAFDGRAKTWICG